MAPLFEAPVRDEYVYKRIELTAREEKEIK